MPTLRPMYIACNVPAGTIESAIGEAIALSGSTGLEVRFTFNGRLMRVNARSDLAALVGLYVDARAGQQIGP